MLPMPREVEERRFLARRMALGLLLILVAAVRSVGFHNADEHFQILEFVGAKLGRTPWDLFRCTTVDTPAKGGRP